MQKIIREGYTIRIFLPEECGYEGYSVKCTYKYIKSKEKYLLSIWLRRDDIDDDFKIDSQEIDAQYIPGTKETIEDNIRTIVKNASLIGFFNRYIERFEYTYACFERGNELFEQEQLEKASVPKSKIVYKTIGYCSNCGCDVKENTESCPYCNMLLDWTNAPEHNEETANDF